MPINPSIFLAGNENQSLESPQKSIQDIDDELKTALPIQSEKLTNRSYWTQRTKNIGNELQSPMLKLLHKRKGEIHAIEENTLSNAKHSRMIKEVLHRGYWMYKKEHYMKQHDKANNAYKDFQEEHSPEKEKVDKMCVAFNNAMDDILG